MESPSSQPRIYAVVQALLVTFLWSTSWLLIKVGLSNNLPPLTFAGLRYTIAFLVLAPFVLANSAYRQQIRKTPGRTWLLLGTLGVVFYTLTQGAQFIGLSLLPAATLSLLLNLTPVLVAVFSGAVNREAAIPLQWAGVGLAAAGVLLYFLPSASYAGRLLGVMVGLSALCANAGSSLLGRRVNRNKRLAPVTVTFVSMGVGGVLLLVSGIVIQGFGRLGLLQWAIILWLAIVNTAFAFTLWNHTLRRLTSIESSVVNGAMLPQVAILAWVFLDEPLSPVQLAALGILTVGTVVVQVAPYKAAIAERQKNERGGEAG